MKKIHVKAVVTVQVPIDCTLDLLFHADEDANVEKAVKALAQRKPYSKADLIDLGIESLGGEVEIVDLSDIGQKVKERFYEGFTVKSFEVTDSR